MDKATFIRNQLQKVQPIEWGDEQAKILCPFHDDSNPSLDIALVRMEKVSVGGFNCWSCREHGGWNKLAAKLGLDLWNPKEYEDSPSNDFFELHREFQLLGKVKEVYEKPVTEGPWDGPWKGMPGWFLRRHGAQKIWDKIAEEYRIYLPIQDIKGIEIGHIKGRADNSDIPNKFKYLHNTDFPSDRAWYCLNFEEKPRAVVAAEGPSDTLRLRSLGVPAIGAFGVSALTDLKIIQLLSRGIKMVVTGFDGDTAGRDATVAFHKQLNDYGIETMNWGLPELNPDGSKCDPGNCPVELVDSLKVYLESMGVQCRVPQRT